MTPAKVRSESTHQNEKRGSRQSTDPNEDIHVKTEEDFFTLCASRQGGDGESFRENLSNKFHFANFSDAQDARGRRELRAVKISALNDPERY